MNSLVIFNVNCLKMSWDIVYKDMAPFLNELFGVSLGYLVHKLSWDIVYKDVSYFLNEFFCDS